MSFGSTLRKLKDRENKVSVLPHLNKVILDESRHFDLADVKAAVKKLNKVMSGSSPDRDVLWKAFFELHTVMYAPPIRKSGVFHPSSLSNDEHCERKLWYDYMGTPYSDPENIKPGLSLKKIFDIGTMFHAYLQAKLHQTGVLKQAEVDFEDFKRKISGHSDGLIELLNEVSKIEEFVLEIKTINSYQFKGLIRAMDKHVTQASLYVDGINKTYKKNITRIIFLYVNKETGDIKEYVEPVNTKSLTKVYALTDSIITMGNTKTVPPRSCADKHVQQAMQCPFVTFCFKKK